MTKWQGPALDPNELAELRGIVCADVAHLQQTWFEGMDFHALRREAVTLRRLLVDNGGDLARLWRGEGREGQITISGVFDLRVFPHWKGLGFATAHPAEAPGLTVGALFMWRIPEVEAPEIQAVLNDNAPDSELPLREFMESVCLVSVERPVRRVDLITYIANRRGGAHSDRKRVPGDPRRRTAWQVLDELHDGRYEVNQREAAFGQLVTIGRAVVDSPDVQALVA